MGIVLDEGFDVRVNDSPPAALVEIYEMPR
jgi:hypothetical protein